MIYDILLNKIQEGGVSCYEIPKGFKTGKQKVRGLYHNDWWDVLAEGTQYQGSEYVAADEEVQLYKEIIFLMIVDLKDSTPYGIQALPEDW